MSIVELRLPISSIGQAMSDMRTWLDSQRTEPLRFTFAEAHGETVICVEFTEEEQAGAFAERFAGRLLSV
jgi:hypothetical protein